MATKNEMRRRGLSEDIIEILREARLDSGSLYGSVYEEKGGEYDESYYWRNVQ